MKLDYETQISPFPLVLSIGTIQKPRLRDIADTTRGMSFDRFYTYETLLKMDAEFYYTRARGEDGVQYWQSLTTRQQDKMTIYDILMAEESVALSYVEMLNFFFVEKVIFKDGFFVLLRGDVGETDDVKKDDIRGVITQETLPEILNILQQICGIAETAEDINNIRFKNKLAKSLYMKMQKAKKEERERKKVDVNYSLPNIISAVSNMHPTINPLNVWDLTLFQLFDAFQRLRVNAIYDIDAVRVSVWGDEKKQFNDALWYKNDYDRNG